MNILELAGHLGADPEIRMTPSGQKVITLRIATKTRKNGVDETLWWRGTIWGDRFDKMLPFLKKGSAIIVVGEMGKPVIYQDKQNSSQISLEITIEMVRFSPFGKTENKDGSSVQNAQSSQPTSQQGQAKGSPDDDEPLPF